MTGADDESILTGPHSPASIAAKVTGEVLVRPVTSGWLFGLFFAFSLMLIFLYSITYLLAKGVGIWGINIPVAWGFAIINFVWWIGIGHAGTFISAILYLCHQQWRTSINRFAEAMTLFALACAGLFPLLHLGRPAFFYWLLPYPDTMDLWPQTRSPLVWDVFAVGTYLIVSVTFWYLGLIPDLASLRDRTKSRFLQITYGTLALGWRGSARHWRRYQTAYLLLAGLATPLVISVHSIVGLDFTVSILPGWHSTIFPPYFVAGAIYSGFAMVLTLIIPLRKFYRLDEYITQRHLENSAKLLLAMGLLTDYGYVMEIFTAWYSDDPIEISLLSYRMNGQYWPVFWMVMFSNMVLLQLLWLKRVRSQPMILFILSFVLNTAMWLERYMIVVTSLAHDHLPSSWHSYQGTLFDWSTLLGSFGLFFVLLLLFIRSLPVMSISELSELAYLKSKEAKPK